MKIPNRDHLAPISSFQHFSTLINKISLNFKVFCDGIFVYAKCLQKQNVSVCSPFKKCKKLLGVIRWPGTIDLGFDFI